MAQTRPPQTTQRSDGPELYGPADDDPGAGWTLFAGMMMIIGGVFNIIDGLVGITNSSYYASVADVRNIHLPITDTIKTWGWVALVFGVLIVIAGAGVLGRFTWARIGGVVLVGLNMIFQLAFLAAFPFWGLIMLLVDGLVIYGILVHVGAYED